MKHLIIFFATQNTKYLFYTCRKLVYQGNNFLVHYRSPVDSAFSMPKKDGSDFRQF